MRNRTHRSPRLRPLALAALAAAALPFDAAAEQRANDWTWTVTPYAWATDVAVDVALDERTLVDQEISAEELLADLDTILQVRIEAQKGRHGFFLDLFDVTLSDAAQSIALPNGAGDVALTPAMGMTIAELGGIFDPQGDGTGFQLLYGARILNERADIDAVFALADGGAVRRDFEVDETFVDALVGFRFSRRFGGRWSYEVKADLSKGGTELTWSAGPALSYAFGDTRRYAATVGYRRMVVDFEATDPAETVDATMTLSGPYVALRVGF